MGIESPWPPTARSSLRSTTLTTPLQPLCPETAWSSCPAPFWTGNPSWKVGPVGGSQGTDILLEWLDARNMHETETCSTGIEYWIYNLCVIFYLLYDLIGVLFLFFYYGNELHNWWKSCVNFFWRENAWIYIVWLCTVLRKSGRELKQCTFDFMS